MELAKKSEHITGICGSLMRSRAMHEL